MGASSGIGYAVAKRLIEEGWMVGLSARRLEPLETLTQLAPERVFTQRIDVTDLRLQRLYRNSSLVWAASTSIFMPLALVNKTLC